MVLLIEKLHKLYAKLENPHHRQHEEALSVVLQAFRSDVSRLMNQVATKPGSELVSLSWLQQCFQILPIINKAFAKLVVGIDYPMTKWKAKTFDAYLNYSLELLDLLNSISSSISHLGQSRLLLSHALSLAESSNLSAIEKLRTIEFKNGSSSPKEPKQHHNSEDEKGVSLFDEDDVVHQALLELRSAGLWICSVVLSGLRGDAKAYMEMRRVNGFWSSNSSLINLDSVIYEVMTEKGVELKEVKELTNAADCLANELQTQQSGDVAEMQTKLEMFEKLVDGLGKEVDCLFSEVLAGRNQLLSGIRHHKK